MSDPLDLDAIAHRIRDCSTYNFGLRNADRLAKEDAPALLAALKEAQAGLATAWTQGYGAGCHNLADIADHFRAGGGVDTIRPPAQNPYIDRTETP